MKKLICLTVLYFIVFSSVNAGEKKLASYVTIVSTSNNIDAEARNFAYMNNLKIVGTRVTKQGDNWVKTIKVIPAN